MVTGWLKHTVIILSSCAVSDLCSLMQFVLSSSEEHSALSGNIQKAFLKEPVFAALTDEGEPEMKRII